MKNFIEVTTSANEKKLLNVTHIFKVENYENKKDKDKGRIFMTPKGNNDSPVQVIHTLESYEQILILIEKAI